MGKEFDFLCLLLIVPSPFLYIARTKPVLTENYELSYLTAFESGEKIRNFSQAINFLLTVLDIHLDESKAQEP